MEWDSSWPTQTFRNPGLWPYTLDYKSTQDCEVGPCPEDSIPGFWVAPMIDWTDQQNIVCSMVDACVNMLVTNNLDKKQIKRIVLVQRMPTDLHNGILTTLMLNTTATEHRLDSMYIKHISTQILSI